jgi:DNA-directed RNA polymerase subunit RPC12/RpoP
VLVAATANLGNGTFRWNRLGSKLLFSIFFHPEPLLCTVVGGFVGAIIGAVRMKRGELDSPHRCPHCDYDLTGNESGVCSECGTKIAKDHESD